MRQKIRVKMKGRIELAKKRPTAVQTMWKKPLRTVDEQIVQRVEQLAGLGCQLLRFAVTSEAQARILGELQQAVSIPLVADIQFDYRLALESIKAGIPKLRINPGNIGSPRKALKVIEKAAEAGAWLRVGVNHGSLPGPLRGHRHPAQAMILAAGQELEPIKKVGLLPQTVVSLKSSDIQTTIEANRLFRRSYPDILLHLGLTEAGPLVPGIVKSSAALFTLLNEGIGETIRVSLTGPEEDEIVAGNEIARAAGKLTDWVNIISCPGCGRTGYDHQNLLAEITSICHTIKKPLTIAVMGCVVNGPQEAAEADLGITGAGRQIIIFKRGQIVAKAPPEQARELFLAEIHRL